MFLNTAGERCVSGGFRFLVFRYADKRLCRRDLTVRRLFVCFETVLHFCWRCYNPKAVRGSRVWTWSRAVPTTACVLRVAALQSSYLEQVRICRSPENGITQTRMRFLFFIGAGFLRGIKRSFSWNFEISVWDFRKSPNVQEFARKQGI